MGKSENDLRNLREDTARDLEQDPDPQRTPPIDRIEIEDGDAAGNAADGEPGEDFPEAED